MSAVTPEMRELVAKIAECCIAPVDAEKAAQLLAAFIATREQHAVTEATKWETAAINEHKIRMDCDKLIDQLRAELSSLRGQLDDSNQALDYMRLAVIPELEARLAITRESAESLEKALRETLSFISIVHPGEEDDVEMAAQIEKIEGLATAALAQYASRHPASGGKENK